MTRRRWIGLAGFLVVVAGLLALALGGSGESHVVPEGGSSFGVAPAHKPHKGTRLLDALAPVLEPEGSSTAPPATAAAAPGAGGTGTLPAAAPRAAARLFLIGFAGPLPTRPVLRRMTQHEWGGVVLEAGNGVTVPQVALLVDRLRRAAARAHHAAPLVAATQPGADGDAVPVRAPLQSRIRDAAAARSTARTIGHVLAPLGIRMALAPSADVGDAAGPWAGRAYSDEPATVAALAAAGAKGFADARVAAAVGHFPGEGAASGDPIVEPATVGLSTDELKRRDMHAFAGVARAAPAIQLSSATYVAFDGVTPATLLPDAVRLLREDLRFRGVVVSGDLAAASLATGRPVADLAVEALNAGCDLLWIPGDASDQEAAWRAVVRGLRTGEVTPSRVADALARVSALRARYGVK
jgi:beta-N-acetylhexosaminidase